MVEVDSFSESACLDVGADAEVGFGVVEDLARTQLVGSGRRGEHRQPADPDQRIVFLDAVGQRRLASHRDGIDGTTGGVQVQAFEAVEELEAHPGP